MTSGRQGHKARIVILFAILHEYIPLLHDRICGSHFFALIMQELQKEGVSVALRSRDDKVMPGTNIYVVDTLGSHIFSRSLSCGICISYILH